MNPKFAIALSLTTLIPLSACGRSDEPSGPSVKISVAPIALQGITNACYRVTVTNAPDRGGEIVWQQDQICATQFGDNRGAITYVGPCDASDPTTPNSVTVELLDLMTGSPTPSPIPDGQYQNPCGEIAAWDGDRATLAASEDGHGPCTINRICEANRDVFVEFNLTVMRDADQGFFDIAVNFEDIFCSAKLDCRAELLHNADGDRDVTAIVAFACATGENQETFLTASDLVLQCDGSPLLPPLPPVLIPASNRAPGQHGAIAPAIYQWANYIGDEQLTSNGQPLEKCYWNRAIGLDTAALAGRNCTLSGVATASSTPLTDAMLTGEGVSYPAVTWSVPVLSADGTLCTNRELNVPDSGVATTYVSEDSPAQLIRSLTSGGSTFACGAPPALTCAAGPVVDGERTDVSVAQTQANTLEVTVGAVTSTVTLPAGFSLGTSCTLDDCCTP